MLLAKSPFESFQLINSGPGTIPQGFRGMGFPGSTGIPSLDTNLKMIIPNFVLKKIPTKVQNSFKELGNEERIRNS